MSKKALIFSLAYYPHLVGGAEVAVKEITDRISPAEIEFDMVTLYAGASRFEKIGNVNIYRVGPRVKIDGGIVPRIPHSIKFQYVFFAFIKALLLHRERRYSFIWSVMASFNGFSALFFKFIHKKVPFFLNLQEGDSFEHIRKTVGYFYPLYVQIFQKADYIQAISNFLSDYALTTMKVKCPVSVIPNGVDYKFFSTHSTSGQKSALMSELSLDPFDTVLITTSRLVPKNSVADIIDSLVYLPHHVKLLILGTGPLEDLLKEKVKLLHLEKRVRFVGYVPHSELPIYLNISHIFIRPSLSEGMGVSFVEAMAAGVPLIATKVGGIPDFLFDRETGLFCEVKNPQDIAQKVEILMQNKELRESIIENARELVRTKYDWDLITRNMLEIFRRF